MKLLIISMETPILMLRSLLDEKLLDDDSQCYSISACPKTVAEEASHVFIKDFAERKDNLDISRKKRVKFIDEFAAVALGFPVSDYVHVQTAIEILTNWLKKLEIFGDVKRQNKFVKRIFRQLTQPFAFRDAKNGNVFQNNFLPLLFMIFDAFEDFAKNGGKMMEVETWDTLFKCVLACTDSVICFNFTNLLSEENIRGLQQRCLTVYFQITLIAGITTKEMWDIFTKFNKKWSFSLNFLVIWEKFVTKLTNMVFARKLSFETEEKIEGGVFIEGKEIETKALDFIYSRFIYSVDRKLASSTPANLQQFQLTLVYILLQFNEFANKENSFFKARFPSTIFFKLFGQSITDLPLKSDESFDTGLSLALGTILLSTSSLEYAENDQNRQKLLQLTLRIAAINRPQLISSFIYYGYCAFAKWNDITPYFAQKVLEIIPLLSIEKTSERLRGDQLFNSLTSMFASSSILYHRTNQADNTLITKVFQKIFAETTIDANRVTMMSIISSFAGEIVLKKINEVFSHSMIRKYATEQMIPYLCTLITMIGTFSRFDSSLYEYMTSTKTISSVISSVISADCRKLANCDLLILATLVTLNSIVENSTNFLTCESNIASILNFCTFVQKLMDNDKKNPVKSKKVIKALHLNIINRLNIHYPSAELYTRKNGSIVGTEEDLKEKLGFTSDCKEYNFVVGSNLFITFLEHPDGKGPIGVVARGQFGRCTWVVDDKFKPEEPSMLSDKLPEEKLEAKNDEELFSSLSPFECIDIRSEINIPEVSFEEYVNEDKKVSAHFKELFNKWLAHDPFCFIDKFDEEKKYLRPRVVDFLLQLGIIDISNKLKVKPIDVEKYDLASIKKNFDSLDTVAKLNITVSHVMLGDNELQKPRNTPAYQDFIRNIGEPFLVDGKWRPTIATSSGLAILQEEESEFPLQIIFNDSNYDFTLQPVKKQVIVITPIGVHNGRSTLYKVEEKSKVREGVSPFSNLEYIVDIKTLRTQIALCVDIMPRFAAKYDMFENSSKRKDALKSLFEEKPDDDIAPKASLSFK